MKAICLLSLSFHSPVIQIILSKSQLIQENKKIIQITYKVTLHSNIDFNRIEVTLKLIISKNQFKP
jgi:hypothetical protein